MSGGFSHITWTPYEMADQPANMQRSYLHLLFVPPSVIATRAPPSMIDTRAAVARVCALYAGARQRPRITDEDRADQAIIDEARNIARTLQEDDLFLIITKLNAPRDIISFTRVINEADITAGREIPRGTVIVNRSGLWDHMLNLYFPGWALEPSIAQMVEVRFPLQRGRLEKIIEDLVQAGLDPFDDAGTMQLARRVAATVAPAAETAAYAGILRKIYTDRYTAIVDDLGLFVTMQAGELFGWDTIGNRLKMRIRGDPVGLELLRVPNSERQYLPALLMMAVPSSDKIDNVEMDTYKLARFPFVEESNEVLILQTTPTRLLFRLPLNKGTGKPIFRGVDPAVGKAWFTITGGRIIASEPIDRSDIPGWYLTFSNGPGTVINIFFQIGTFTRQPTLIPHIPDPRRIIEFEEFTPGGPPILWEGDPQVWGHASVVEQAGDQLLLRLHITRSFVRTHFPDVWVVIRAGLVKGSLKHVQSPLERFPGSKTRYRPRYLDDDRFTFGVDDLAEDRHPDLPPFDPADTFIVQNLRLMKSILFVRQDEIGHSWRPRRQGPDQKLYGIVLSSIRAGPSRLTFMTELNRTTITVFMPEHEWKG